MQTYHIFTIGCQMNKSDSERIKGYLEGCGLSENPDLRAADVVVLTTCGVRQKAEDRIYGLIPDILEHNPVAKIVLTGCLALRPDVRERLEGKIAVWLPISDLPKLASALGLAETNQEPAGSLTYLSITPDYESAVSAYVPIGNGCNNFCSYCVVPYARGREVYRPHQEIIAEVAGLLKRGYKEITLIAQNVNSYKSPSDESIDFADLLTACDALPGTWWLRFATSHPKDMSDKLIEAVAQGQHITQYFHLAAQAGDDEILRQMNRRYTAEHFLNLVKKIRAASPEATISTDIIVGYPGETDEQYQHTVNLMREASFDQAFIAQYSPRPGTVAAKKEDDVPRQVKKQRDEELNDLLRGTALANNQKFADRTLTVLVDAVKKNKQGEGYIAIGKTAEFKTVRFPVVDKSCLGNFCQVKVERVADFALYSSLVE
jgi:tRNA-2-methylthio-N6-dimethylallyladenosine synthase